MKKTIFLIIAILVVAGGTAYYLYSKNHKTTNYTSSTSTQTSSQAASAQPNVDPASKCITHTEREILYCDSGFSDYLNVILGEKVTVKNSSSKVLDFETYAATDNSTTY